MLVCMLPSPQQAAPAPSADDLCCHTADSGQQPLLKHHDQTCRVDKLDASLDHGNTAADSTAAKQHGAQTKLQVLSVSSTPPSLAHACVLCPLLSQHMLLMCALQWHFEQEHAGVATRLGTAC